MQSASHITLAEDFLKRYPPTALGRPFLMQLARGQIDEAEQAWPGFKESLRICALDAADHDELDRVRRALQCLAFVGKPEDVRLIQQFLNHPVAEVVQDARTCIFEIEHRDPSLSQVET